jgi:hypothetical protein
MRDFPRQPGECRFMKRKSKRDSEADDDLEISETPPEFFRRGVMGKYYADVMMRSNVIRIAPDLCDAFPNEKAVNQALRMILRFKDALKQISPEKVRRKSSKGGQAAIPEFIMLRTVEATIDKNGKVKLAEAVSLRGTKRALVTILDEASADDEVPNEAAILSESALSDWLSKEEDEAWKHLADLPDLDKPRNGRKGRR